MPREFECPECGNVTYYKNDGLYITYIKIWVDLLGTPHQQNIEVSDDKEAKERFNKQRAAFMAMGASNIKLLKKTVNIRRLNSIPKRNLKQWVFKKDIWAGKIVVEHQLLTKPICLTNTLA